MLTNGFYGTMHLVHSDFKTIPEVHGPTLYRPPPPPRPAPRARALVRAEHCMHLRGSLAACHAVLIPGFVQR